MQVAQAYESTERQHSGIVPNFPSDATGSISEVVDLRVLVVEDSEMDFRIINRTLQLMDTYRAHCFKASNIEAVKRLAGKNQFDVALVDFCLGVDTGTLAISELGGRHSAMPLILLTGMPGQDVREIALRAGVIQCLDKNQLSPAILETAIRSARHTHELEVKLQETIDNLEMANLAKADFFARMGHDLKTPLNAILGYAEMISNEMCGVPVPEKYASYARSISEGGNHLLQVLDAMIHHAVGQGSYGDGIFKVTELNRVAEKAALLVQNLVDARGHTLEVSLPDVSPLVRCQPPVLAQAVVNLLSNAVKYTPRGGTIRLEVSGDPLPTISVRDDGIGMTDRDVKVALLPFGRVDLPPERAQDGTGVGLPMAKDIVKTHKGRLDIESAPNRGTRVTITLPPAQRDENAADEGQ